MRRVGLLVGLAVVGSQAGHVIAYAARYGAAAQQIQSTGAHAYFPWAAKTMLGVAAVGLLMTLLVLAMARILAGGGRRIAGGPSFINLFAILFTVQLVLFVTQEAVEAAVAAAPANSDSSVALWGMLGQLPAAALAALALSWLWSRVEAALDVLRSTPSVERWCPSPASLSVPAWPVYLLVAADPVPGSRHARRGPPSSFTG